MAIAFKPPEIQSIGHYQQSATQVHPSPPPSPPPVQQAVVSASAAVLQNSSQGASVVDGATSITVTDSVPRSSVIAVQHQQPPILVPQSVVFHPIPPIFLVPHHPHHHPHHHQLSPPSPPPSPVYRIVGPRQPCPPAERCAVCKDIERGSYC